MRSSQRDACRKARAISRRSWSLFSGFGVILFRNIDRAQRKELGKELALVTSTSKSNIWSYLCGGPKEAAASSSGLRTEGSDDDLEQQRFHAAKFGELGDQKVPLRPGHHFWR